jgi:hypothetical protein
MTTLDSTKFNKQAMWYNGLLRRVRLITAAVEKHEVLQTLSVSVALVIPHAMCKRHSHLWPSPLYHICPHYLINGTILKKQGIENKTCFDILYKF